MKTTPNTITSNTCPACKRTAAGVDANRCPFCGFHFIDQVPPEKLEVKQQIMEDFGLTEAEATKRVLDMQNEGGYVDPKVSEDSAPQLTNAELEAKRAEEAACIAKEETPEDQKSNGGKKKK